MSEVYDYSKTLECLYDEQVPQDRADGVHHSIFRVATSSGETGRKLTQPRIQDFAVIWDEDHDKRVIGVVEEMHASGLLFPVLFIGERSGSLSVIMSEKSAHGMGATTRRKFEMCVTEIAADVPCCGDYWPVYFGVFPDNRDIAPGPNAYCNHLINGDDAKTHAYLCRVFDDRRLGHFDPKAVAPIK